MIPLKRFIHVKLESAEPGSILLGEAGKDSIAGIVAEIYCDGQKGRFLSTFNPLPHLGRCVSIPISGKAAPWIGVDNWEIRVDPTSAYSILRTGAKVGDVFATEDTFGFVLSFDDHDDGIFINIKGQQIEAPSFNQVCVGYRKWDIVHSPVEDGEPVVVFSRDLKV